MITGVIDRQRSGKEVPLASKIGITESYFNSWITRDSSIILRHFTDNVQYTECYGPVYRNKSEVLQWFYNWNQNGRVLAWTVRNHYECKSTLIAEWNFRCIYKNELCDFDGVSVIQFNRASLISSVHEYEAKSTHFYPYGDETPGNTG